MLGDVVCLCTITDEARQAMVFGVIPDVRSTLNFQGKSIEWVDEPKHLGTTFTSRKGGLFARMYATKANCQCGAALTESAACKGGDSLQGAHSKPSPEIAIDVGSASLALLEAVEDMFTTVQRSQSCIETRIVPFCFIRIVRLIMEFLPSVER